MLKENIDLLEFYKTMLKEFNAELPIKDENDFALVSSINHFERIVENLRYNFVLDINKVNEYYSHKDYLDIKRGVEKNHPLKAGYINNVSSLTYTILHEIGHFKTLTYEKRINFDTTRKTFFKRLDIKNKYYFEDSKKIYNISHKDYMEVYKGFKTEFEADNWALDTIKTYKNKIKEIEKKYEIGGF